MKGDHYKILIVDDDNFLLDIYSMKFSQEGFEVLTATSGEDALEKLKNPEMNFDILLLDMVMPVMDGLSLLRQAKNQNLLEKMVVIFLTNQGQPEDIKKAEELEVDGYIVKATSIPSEVLAEVKKIADDKLA